MVKLNGASQPISIEYKMVPGLIQAVFKDDLAFSLPHQDLHQILVICLPYKVPVVKILKKNWGHRENLGESGGQSFN